MKESQWHIAICYTPTPSQ